MDITEDNDAFTFKVEVPGMNKEDFHVKVEDKVLTVSGERKFENEEKKDNYRRIERSYGSFSRSFSLPTPVMAERISATCSNGVLAVRLPKAEGSKTRVVKISPS